MNTQTTTVEQWYWIESRGAWHMYEPHYRGTPIVDMHTSHYGRFVLTDKDGCEFVVTGDETLYLVRKIEVWR